jgi:hypothetical protein
MNVNNKNTPITIITAGWYIKIQSLQIIDKLIKLNDLH